MTDFDKYTQVTISSSHLGFNIPARETLKNQFYLHRITATCDSRNLASARVMEVNGMRREAFFIKHLWQKGEWRDSCLYAILDEEWPFHFA